MYIVEARFWNENTQKYSEKTYEFSVSDSFYNQYWDWRNDSMTGKICLGFFNEDNEFKELLIENVFYTSISYTPECGYINFLMDCTIVRRIIKDLQIEGCIFGKFNNQMIESGICFKDLWIYGYHDYSSAITKEQYNDNEYWNTYTVLANKLIDKSINPYEYSTVSSDKNKITSDNKKLSINKFKISVNFDNGHKTYDYTISPYLRSFLAFQDTVNIFRNKNSDYNKWYRGTSVNIKSISEASPEEIVSLKEMDGLSYTIPLNFGKKRIVMLANKKKYFRDMLRYFPMIDLVKINEAERKKVYLKYGQDFENITTHNNIFDLTDTIQLCFMSEDIQNNSILKEDYLSTLSYSTNSIEKITNNVSVTNSLTDLVKTSAETPNLSKKLKQAFGNKNKNNKGDTFMKLFNNLNVGKYTREDVSYSLKGMAYKTIDEKYVAYCDGDLVDVTDLLIDMKDMLYSIPVSYNSIKAGDIILHNDTPVIVSGNPTEEAPFTIPVIFPKTKETRNIMPEKNIFNFNFVVKIVNLMEGLFKNNGANDTNPFGNLLPFMFLNNNSDEGTFKNLMLMNMVNGGAANTNPLFLYALMGDKSNDDLFKIMLLSQMNSTTFNFSTVFGSPTSNVDDVNEIFHKVLDEKNKIGFKTDIEGEGK